VVRDVTRDDRDWVREALVGEWAPTTNNNIAAIAFYQRLGMDLRALHRHAFLASRELKPTIPVRDAAGVPICHELEFELLLEA